MAVSSEANEKLILALPKGRIFKEAAPLFARAGIEPESAFADPDARQLRFTTNHADLDIIRVRSFDVATFVAFGAAQLGVAGKIGPLDAEPRKRVEIRRLRNRDRHARLQRDK